MEAYEELQEELEKLRLLEEIKERAKELQPLIEDILGRETRFLGRYGAGPSWNVDTYRADTSGKTGDYKVSRSFDILWERHIEISSIHEHVQEEISGFFGNKRSRMWNWGEGLPGLEDREYDYKLYHDDSGNHAVLVSFDGSSVDRDTFVEIRDVIECVMSAYPDEGPPGVSTLAEADEWAEGLAYVDKEHLDKLIIFCNSLDKYDATADASCAYNYRRSEAESAWADGDFGLFSDNELEAFLENPEVPRSVKRKICKYLK